MIDLHQLHRRSVHFNHGNQHPSTRTVRCNDYLLVADCLRQVVDLEGNVRNGLHQVWIRRVVPVSLPLNAEWVVLVITYRHLQVRQWNLASEICGRRYPYVVILHYSTLAHTVDGPVVSRYTKLPLLRGIWSAESGSESAAILHNPVLSAAPGPALERPRS